MADEPFATAADRGRDGLNARWGDQFVIAEPEPFPNKVTWRTYVLRPIWWLVSRVIR